MGQFADLCSSCTTGHSGGVASLARSAAVTLGPDPAQVEAGGRAGLVHDLGRVTVPARIWLTVGPLTADDREKVRLHPYHTERALAPSLSPHSRP